MRPLGMIVASKKKKSPRTNPVPSKRPATAKAAPASLLPKLRITQSEFSFDPIDVGAWQKKLQRAAMEWTYVVRNRQRWRTEDKTAASINERARKQLLDLDLPASALVGIAECGVVEVVVPFQEEKSGWEARIFPWEFVIAAATRELRQGRSLTVSRVLDTPRRPGNANPVAEAGSLRRECARKLRAMYAVRHRTRNLRTKLRRSCGLSYYEADRADTGKTRKPRSGSLRRDIIHLAGFDTHEGLRALKKGNTEIPDGYLLEGHPEEPAHAVDAQMLGERSRPVNGRRSW